MQNRYLKLLTIIVFFNSLSTIIDYDADNIFYWVKFIVSLISLFVCIYICKELKDEH